MLALSCSFSHATAGLMIQFLCLLKVLCLSFARLRPSYALDSRVYDPVVIMKVASSTILKIDRSNTNIVFRMLSGWVPKCRVTSLT